MSRDPRAALDEYALGILPEDERAEVEALLAGSPEARRQVDEARAAAARLADALPPAASPARLRSRLLDTLAGPGRFRPFASTLERHLDLRGPELDAVLAAVDDAAGWTSAPFPGTRYRDLTPGPGAAAAEAGLVRLAAGARFPRHGHHGPETAIILEGTLIEGEQTYHPGDVVQRDADAVHEFAAGPARDLVFAVVHGGIDFHRR